MYLRIGLLQELGSDKDQVSTRIGVPQGLGSLQDWPPQKYLRIELLQELGCFKDLAQIRSGLKKDWALTRVRL